MTDIYTETYSLKNVYIMTDIYRDILTKECVYYAKNEAHGTDN